MKGKREVWGGDRGKYIPLFPPSSSKTSVKVQSEKGRTMNVPSPFLSSFMVKSGFLSLQPFSGVQYTAGIEHSDMEFFVILNPNINVTPFKTLSKYLKGSEERKGDGYTFRNLNHILRSKIKPIGYLGHVRPFEVKDKAFRLPKGPDVETFMRTNL